MHFQGKHVETGEWYNTEFSVKSRADLENWVTVAYIAGYHVFSVTSDEGKILVEATANGTITYNLDGYRF